VLKEAHLYSKNIFYGSYIGALQLDLKASSFIRNSEFLAGKNNSDNLNSGNWNKFCGNVSARRRKNKLLNI